MSRPPDYDDDFHPEDCERMGHLGYFACDMSTEWGVEPQTLCDWKNVHPKFSQSYTRAKAARASWLMTTLRENVVSSKECQLNTHAMAMMMRYDGLNTEERNIKLKGISKCKNAKEKFDCLMTAFEAGKVTPKEAQTLSDVFTKEMNATQVADIRKDLDLIQKAIGSNA